MTSMTVRPAHRGDGLEVATVWQHVGAFYTQLDAGYFQVPELDDTAAGLEAAFDGPDADDTLHLVVEVDGRVMGWLSAHVERPHDHPAAQLMRGLGRTRLAVDTLVVDPSVWRCGAGRALLAAAEAWGRSRGAELARLETYAQSPVSIPFYQGGMGYRPREVVYEKSLAPSTGELGVTFSAT